MRGYTFGWTFGWTFGLDFLVGFFGWTLLLCIYIAEVVVTEGGADAVGVNNRYHLDNAGVVILSGSPFN